MPQKGVSTLWCGILATIMRLSKTLGFVKDPSFVSIYQFLLFILDNLRNWRTRLYVRTKPKLETIVTSSPTPKALT